MSNTNNSVVYDVEPFENVEPAPYPEVPQVQEPQTEEPAPKKKTAAARIFGLLLAALSAAIVFLQIGVVNGTAVETSSLLTVLKDVFGGNGSKLFNMLPTLADAATPLGVYAGVSFYVFVLALALSSVFGLITLFAGKSCLLRTTAFFSAFGFLLYTLSVIIVAFVGTGKVTLDIVCIACTAVALLVYLVLAIAKNGKKAWVNFVQCLLTVAVAAVAIIAATKFEAPLTTALGEFAKTLALVIALVLTLNVAIGGIRMQTKKGLTVDMIRYIVQMVIALALCYAAIAGKAEDKTFLLFSIVAAVVSLLQIIICAIQINCGKEKVVEEVVEEPAPVVEEFVREEFAEALPYEGGPVEGVQVAEEVNPTFIAPPPQVQTAGYDFYNCKSFDPFIAILNNDERNQFTELFILKFKGVMPEIPEYVVGGDNKEFFRKLFIYLGQYRDRIPDGLLSKIYQFAIKM